MLHEEQRTHKNESTLGGTTGRIPLPQAARRLSATFLAISVAALIGAWCWIEFFDATAPNLFMCFSVRFLGVPCPMCGLTHGLHAVWQGDLDAARAFNPLSLAVFVFLAAEIFFRLILLRARCTPGFWKSIAHADILIHAALASTYFGYALAWMLHRCF